MKRALPLVLVLGLMGFELSGCSSDAVDPAEGGGDGGSSGEGGNAESCPAGPDYTEIIDPYRVDVVTALLVDQEGEPIAGEEVQVCGIDVCFAGKSKEGGRVAVSAGQPILKPAFKFGLGIVSARFAWLLPDEPMIDLGTVQTVRLPPLGSGEPLVAGQSASSNGLTLSIAPGATVEFEPITFLTADEQQLRAVEVPIETAPAVVDPELGFGLVYAATPTETAFCPPARLSVDNTPGWDAGASVEVWLHGVDLTEEWAPYGSWAKVADARVSDDGARIETVEPGLPKLGVLGFKLP